MIPPRASQCPEGMIHAKCNQAVLKFCRGGRSSNSPLISRAGNTRTNPDSRWVLGIFHSGSHWTLQDADRAARHGLTKLAEALSPFKRTCYNAGYNPQVHPHRACGQPQVVAKLTPRIFPFFRSAQPTPIMHGPVSWTSGPVVLSGSNYD